MKNYKAEIEKILPHSASCLRAQKDMENMGFSAKCVEPDRTTKIDKILSLFREIAKEAVGKKERVPRYIEGGDWIKNLGGITTECRNQLRSEILSNIEEMIK